MATFGVVAGQFLVVTVAPGDLWNAGILPRWSNADGLTGPMFATLNSEAGQQDGTRIGSTFADWSQGNLTAPYGGLVGQLITANVTSPTGVPAPAALGLSLLGLGAVSRRRKA